MLRRVHAVAVAKDDKHDFTTIIDIDPSVRWNSQRPHVLVAIELVDVEFRAPGPRLQM